jgi:hypothetical protein
MKAKFRLQLAYLVNALLLVLVIKIQASPTLLYTIAVVEILLLLLAFGHGRLLPELLKNTGQIIQNLFSRRQSPVTESTSTDYTRLVDTTESKLIKIRIDVQVGFWNDSGSRTVREIPASSRHALIPPFQPDNTIGGDND